MFCQACGSVLHELFCSTCGTPAGTGAVTVTNPTRGKNRQLTGAALAIVALFVFFPSLGDDGSKAGVLIGALLFFFGSALYLRGRVEHWYHAE